MINYFSKTKIDKKRKIMVPICFIVFSLLFFSTKLIAADAISPSTDAKERLEKIVEEAILKKEDSKTQVPQVISVTDTTDPARPVPLPASATDPETHRLYEKALQDYYSYRSNGLAHRGAVFRWQLFSARMIFIIVLGLVICGVVFAGIQFRIGMQHYSQSGLKVEELTSEVEFSKEGMKISSPIIGLIILFLSLGFFYLYLVYVYPIENVF